MKNTAKMREGRLAGLMMVFAAVFLSLFITAAMPGRAEAAGLKLSKSKVTLYLSGKKTAKVTATYKGEKVTPKFSSSSKHVAVVSGSGKIKAKHTGSCTITARYKNKKAKIKVRVKARTAAWNRAVRKYNSFLMQPYVTYKDSGARDQADLFFSLDLDGSGVPELFTAVASGTDRYYVLYSISGGKINFGQRLGAAAAFTWYSKAKVLGYRTYSGKKSIYHYARYQDGSLDDLATVTVRGKTTTYRAGGGKVSALSFRSYVDHDLLNYEGGKAVTPYVNTPQNRKAHLG